MQPRLQCHACPFKKSTDPNDIPNGYDVEKHLALKKTIAEPGQIPTARRHVMACHETPVGEERHCVGWLVHQLNEGNNIGLRLAVMQGHVDANVRTVGPQHTRFEDTLPKQKRKHEVAKLAASEIELSCSVCQVPLRECEAEGSCPAVKVRARLVTKDGL